MKIYYKPIRKKRILLKNIRCIATLILTMAYLQACDDFLSIEPPRTEVVSETVFNNNAAATSAINGIYSLMMENDGLMNSALERFTGISSDELILHSNSDAELQFYHNSLHPTNHIIQSTFWQEPYKYINNANAIIEGSEKSSGLSANIKDQLLGEARFIRAFCHFYLVNLFGDIPYITKTDFELNAVAGRDKKSDVIQHIITDLLEAATLLDDDFVLTGTQRIRPNKGAALALLARTYLYAEDWTKSEQFASQIIDNIASYALSQDLAEVFLPSSKETIWQLKPVQPGNNTSHANLFVLNGPPDGFGKKYSISTSLYNRFETGDARQAQWLGSTTTGTTTFFYPYKYKQVRDGSTSPSEYLIVFRLAEQFLIRAEARAHLNKLVEAIADLDMIRNRAGLPKLQDVDPSINKDELLLKIYNERATELFAEWGHRWLDLKRTGRTDAILTSVKPNWKPASALFPIPQVDLNSNPNLLPQNIGY